MPARFFDGLPAARGNRTTRRKDSNQMVDAKLVMQLRNETGAGVNDCKAALSEAGGDFEKAKEHLRKKGTKIAEKKAGRQMGAGIIACYLHPTPETARVGVMVKIGCETDFVGRNPAVAEFAREVCLHVAALNTPYISREEIPADVVNKEREIYREQVKDKPAAAIDKIVEGKLEKYFEDHCLLDQFSVKQNDKKWNALLTELIAKMGENMKILEMARFQVGS
jgi:elongation factor Ts